MTSRFVSALIALGLLVGCNKSESQESPPASRAGEDAQKAKALPKKESPAPRAAQPSDAPEAAEVGKPAPNFSLPDLSGNEVQLSSHQGKIIVLEWFNPGCPFVKAAHTKGSLIDTAKKLTGEGVVYLAINSGAPGKQGHGKEANEKGKSSFGLEHPILLDETGEVGRLYGATNTPHIFIIDKNGTLAYAGAVDNSPDGEGESPEGGKLVNYLTQAVGELQEDKPVSVSKTKAYGCSVKYGS